MADENWYKKYAEYIMESNKTFFVMLFRGVWEGFTEMFDKVIVLAWRFWTEKAGKVEAATWDGMLQMYLDAGVIDQPTRDSLYRMKDMMTPYDIALFGGTIMTLSGGWLGAMMAAPVAKIVQSVNEDMRPTLPQYRDVLQAAFVAPEKADQVRDVMRKSGFTDEHMELLFLANYRLYDLMTVKDLFLRKVLTEEQMFVRMRELGYTDTRTKEIIQAWEIIPGPQDLFWLVGKEAFEPDAIALLGLGDEFPEDQVEWLQKQGVSRFWAEKYWAAHWDQPSIQMGFEMLHRGVIDWEVLNVLFKTIEMPPYWREKLTEIAYRPYSRVDVRRMQDMNVLTTDDVFKAYTDIGYAPDKAGKMTEFTLRYNLQNNKELTKSQIMRSYMDGLITRVDAKDMLIAIDYSDDLAEYNLVLAEFQRDLDYQDDMVKNIATRFQNNLISETTARQKLNAMNLPAVRVEILMQKWLLSVYTDTQVPSKTDMEKFYLNDLMTKDEYHIELKRLGYNFRYRTMYIAMSDKKRGG